MSVEIEAATAPRPPSAMNRVESPSWSQDKLGSKKLHGLKIEGQAQHKDKAFPTWMEGTHDICIHLHQTSHVSICDTTSTKRGTSFKANLQSEILYCKPFTFYHHACSCCRNLRHTPDAVVILAAASRDVPVWPRKCFSCEAPATFWK